MSGIRLADEDRARISDQTGKDVPEWLEVDVFSVTNREAIILAGLHKAFKTPFLWRRSLNPSDDDETLAALDDLVDAKTLPEAALVTVAALRRRLVELHALAAEQAQADAVFLAWTALVWLALRRNGIETDLSTLEFSIDQIDTRFAPVVEDPDPGKDDEPASSGETEPA